MNEILEQRVKCNIKEHLFNIDDALSEDQQERAEMHLNMVYKWAGVYVLHSKNYKSNDDLMNLLEIYEKRVRS